MTDQDFFSPGQYSFPFSFVLNQDLPGSFEKIWSSHNRETFGKIKYKIKAGLQNQIRGTKIFGKWTIILDERHLPEEINIAPPLLEKNVRGYCFCSHGKYKLKAIFKKNKYLVGNSELISLAVDASEASSDIKNLVCEFFMITTLKANGRSDSSKEILYTCNFEKIKAKSSKKDENCLAVNIEIKPPGEMQASTKSSLISNQFYLSCKAEIDGCVYCDTHPVSEIKVDVFNKYYKNPDLDENPFQGDWNPQKFDPYFVELNDDQFKMDENFKKHYKPMPHQDQDISD